MPFRNQIRVLGTWVFGYGIKFTSVALSRGQKILHHTAA
jgi:hypothetical protein